jgi:hypothetical protein
MHNPGWCLVPAILFCAVGAAQAASDSREAAVNYGKLPQSGASIAALQTGKGRKRFTI